MIELRNVTKEYSKGHAALNGVSVRIERGEFVFIVGDSGSGKSTLIRLIMKELNPTEGTIIVNGQNLNRMKRRNIAKYRRGLGVVFQDFRLLKDRNIYENIAFALRVTETPTKVIKKKVPAALSLVGLAQKYKSFPKELSGGEQQRVAIARAIVNEPAILLADEPTGNLDPTNSWEIMSLLKEANERGTTVLVVTHNQEIVNEMNERVITMKQGVRVAIARAIVNEPAILLADEPTGNLDPTNSWEIMSLLKEANERGTTVLVVTHNQEIVNEMNERVITMKQGVIVSDEQKGGYIDED